jgi:hypothetical protein
VTSNRKLSGAIAQGRKAKESIVMVKKKAISVVRAELIERHIHIIRGQRVMLDTDLADLYGVSTKRLNEQVKRNRKRFPLDFAYQLNLKEVMDLRSQIATSNKGLGGPRYLPWVFTEQGVAMLSSVLRSPTAIKVNIEIMRAFVRVRRLLATPRELIAQVAKLADTVKVHDEKIDLILDTLRQMLEPPPEEKPKRRIGFQIPSPPETSNVP